MSDMTYLDNASTTFPKPECVYRRVDYVQRNQAVNIGRGSYAISRKATQIVDETRELMAKLVNVDIPHHEAVVFTPSATIALNEVVFGIKLDEFKTVYVTPFEHNAVARPLEMVREERGFKLLTLPFNMRTLEPDFNEIRRMFTENPPDYVFMNQLSNVTGNIIPIREIGSIAKGYEAIVVVDASQSLGLLDINMQRDNIDFIVFAGHKNLYAPLGIGGFITNGKHKLIPAFAGGTGSDSLNLQMPSNGISGFEFASHNIVAIAGLNEALKWLYMTGRNEILSHKKMLMLKLVKALSTIPKVTMYLPRDMNNHISVLSINVEGYEASEVGMILDQDYKIAVRTGYHCAPFIHKLIHSTEYQGTVRISLSYFNSEDDINKFAIAISEL